MISPKKGEKLLERLLRDGVPVMHDCGGKLACSSCLVIIREGTHHLSVMSEDELDLIERSASNTPGARLACQAVASGGELVVELPQSAVPARVTGISPIRASVRAAGFLAAQLAKHPGAEAVRVAVEAAGCSGLRYRVDPAEAVRDDDTVFDLDGVRLVVDALSLPHVQGTRLDLVREGLAERLRFDNPNVRQSCGCGESFGT